MKLQEVVGCVMNVSNLSLVVWCKSVHTEESVCSPFLLPHNNVAMNPYNIILITSSGGD